MEKCIAGCKVYHGGERKHHVDCPFYKGSLSEYYDNLLSNINRVEIINHTSSKHEIGRIFTYRGKVEISLQDDGETIKVFI